MAIYEVVVSRTVLVHTDDETIVEDFAKRAVSKLEWCDSTAEITAKLETPLVPPAEGEGTCLPHREGWEDAVAALTGEERFWDTLSDTVRRFAKGRAKLRSSDYWEKDK